MISFSAANTGPVTIEFPSTPELHTPRAANDRTAPSQRRTVLIGCLALLGVLAVGIAARSLDLRPLAECQAAPVRLALGGETTATMTMRAGTACAISLVTPDMTVADLRIAAGPRHGTVTTRGRTGAIYRPGARYRGDDSFDLALSGRTDGADGIAVVRVQVTVR